MPLIPKQESYIADMVMQNAALTKREGTHLDYPENQGTLSVWTMGIQRCPGFYVMAEFITG